MSTGSIGRRGVRLALAVAIAAAVSAAVGGLWSFAGLPGGPGPVFGLTFAAVFVFGGLQSRAKADP